MKSTCCLNISLNLIPYNCHWVTCWDFTQESILMRESSNIPKSLPFKTPILKLAVCPQIIHNFKFKWSIVLRQTEYKSENPTTSSIIQYFEADFLWKVSLKIMNSGIILKTFTHAFCPELLLLFTKRFALK